MKAVEALRGGWSVVWGHKKLWLGWYLCSLAFAIVAVTPLRGWLKSAAGHSVDLLNGLGEFDFTFYTDLIRNHGDFWPYILNILLISVCYLTLIVFLSAATLHVYVHQRERVTLREWINGGVRHFWPMLRLALCFLLVHGVLLAICIAVLIGLGINPMTMESDAIVLRNLRIVGGAYVTFFVIAMIFHTFAKIQLIQAGHGRALRATRDGIRFVFGNFGKVMLICGFGAILFIGLVFLRRLLNGTFSETNLLSLLLLFISGQLLIIARIGLRLLVLGSGVELTWAESIGLKT